jgi:elongation factor 1-gamma
MSLTIYTYPGNYRVAKAKIAAAYNSIEINEPTFTFGVDNKSPAFLAKNPQGKVPLLDTPDGPVWESNAIARYVARMRADTHLLGKEFHEQALVDQWMDFSTTELEPARSLWMYPIQGYLQYNPKTHQEAKKDFAKSLKVLNDHLLFHTYLVGNHVTLADITIVAALAQPFQMVLTPEYLEPFPNVVRWFTTMINQPQFAKVLGKIEFAQTEAQPEKKGKEGKEAKEEKGSNKGSDSNKGKKEKKEKAPKEPKEAKEKPAKEEKKKKKDEEDDGGDDDIAAQEAAEAAKKKKDHPLLQLPKSTMDLDATKKLYFSKLPFNPDFWNEFWPTFDKEGFSFWSATYNYDDENTVFFQSQNHLGGFLQRADECRKFAFGVMFLYGVDEDTPPYRTAGCWLFRGDDLTPEMKEHPSSEYFTWTKLSTESDEDKETIRNFFQADSFRGQHILDRRFLK